MTDKKDDLPIHYIPDRNAAWERFASGREEPSLEGHEMMKDAFREGFNACFRRLKNRVAP